MTERKLLPGNQGVERREHLKRYLLACVQDSVLSWADFANPDAFGKFIKTISNDTKIIIMDLGRSAGGGLLRTAGAALAGIAEDVVAGRRTR